MSLRVHHINCGTLCPPFARWVNGTGGIFDAGRMLCHCLIVETKDGLGLVDTGFGVADVEEPGTRLPAAFRALTRPRLKLGETALSQLKRLGFRREDVRHVLMTHLDLDHAGGLSDFPTASVHLHRLEHDAALNRPTRQERHRYRTAQWAHGPRWVTHDTSGESWLGFDSVRALPGTSDELLLVPLFGHTRGHSGIAVQTKDGWLLHAGDAYFAHDEIHATPPSCPPFLSAFQSLMETDGPARLHNQARLRELAARPSQDVRIICAHDATEFDAFQRPSRPPPAA
jgi:glyoxylase-like metal-dependent hydrolase (beta-lactamase superfamily II)